MNMKTETLYTAPHNGGALQYKLITTPDLDGTGGIWSLALIRLESDGEVESRLLYDIARTPECAARIAALFCRHTVLPSTAVEVLDDLLAADDQLLAVNSAASASVR